MSNFLESKCAKIIIIIDTMDIVMRYITELCIACLVQYERTLLGQKDYYIKKETVWVKRQIIMSYKAKKVKST